MNPSSLAALPNQHWHCYVELNGEGKKKAGRQALVNDLTKDRLVKEIIGPWHAGRQFTVGGLLIREKASVSTIKITHTEKPAEYYSQQHYDRMRSQGVCDMATNTAFIPLREGENHTNALLFESLVAELPQADEELIVHLCKRVPQAHKPVLHRRAGKPAFQIQDEYDVQDFIHALVRAYLKYSVQEDPIGKIGGVKSSRADISIEDIGVLIEAKFVRTPNDQKEIVKQLSEDLVVYTKWAPLKVIVFVIYNSQDLPDAEALMKLEGTQTVMGKSFRTRIVLI